MMQDLPVTDSMDKIIYSALSVTMNYLGGFQNGADNISKILAFSSSIVWRNVLSSDNQVAKVWDRLGSVVDPEAIIQLTNEFMALINWPEVESELCNRITGSVVWFGQASAIPSDLRRLAAPRDAVMHQLSINPWLVYLYCLNLSDIRSRIYNLVNLKQGKSR